MRLGLVAVALSTLALAGSGGGAASGTCPGDSALGSFAFVRGGALLVVDLATCRERTLVARGATAVTWSPDGRFLADGDRIVAASSGASSRPLGHVESTWAPASDLLAGVTPGGGVIVGGPGMRTRHLLPDCWGALGILWTPQGDALGVVRTRSKSRRNPYPEELWLAPLSGKARFVTGPIAVPYAPELASFSPDGRWLLWWPLYDDANSANADGVPLNATKVSAGRTIRVLPRMLHSGDFSSWCGSRLVVAAGQDRYTTHGKRLVVATAPGWQPLELSDDPGRSWVWPACSPDGRTVVASAGRNWVETRIGHEQRSLWLVPLDGGPRKRLTSAPLGRTDERPQWSRDGKWILFVRRGTLARDGTVRGALYAWHDGRVLGPIVDLATTADYYGHDGWAGQTAWRR